MMRVFPQLTTGAAALYPVRRKRLRRTVVNTLADGSSVTYSDPDSAATHWELEASGLSEAEWTAIETLFAEAEGRLGVFTFLEPAGNLLAQSEEMDAAEWDADALVAVSVGVSDPLGGTGAALVASTSPVAAELGQVLGVPGDFRYTLSAWVRQATSGSVTLFASTTGGEVAEPFALSSTWRRISMPVDLGLETETVKFGVRFAAGGGSVEVFGMQVEAQPAAGEYQRTGAKSGVHSHARFMDDALTVRARGTDVYDAVMRIVSKGS
jgi:hypothetical protein